MKDRAWPGCGGDKILFHRRPLAAEGSFRLQHAGAGLEKIVATSLRNLRPAEAVLSAWPMVCGSAVAERTRAESYADGILYVIVADVRWKRELQMLAPRYVAAINRYVTHRVDRIEFVTNPRAAAPGTTTK